jgi:peptidoglycan/xylan/chitin deacetylase (PgdA/CDA1 family)
VSRRITLCYHAVSERWPAALSVTPARLSDQISLLLARGYRGTTFTELVESTSTEPLMAITFDDAFRSVAELGVPVLERLGVPATMFVPTYFPGRDALAWPGIVQWLTGPFADEMQPLSWDEVRGLADSGWEIGSHTVSHPRLPSLDDEQLDLEMRRSKLACEEQLGRPCTSIAYPYGDYDDRVVVAAQAAGYTAAATLTDLLPWPPARLRWPRVGVYHLDHAMRFRLKVSPRVRRLRQHVPGRSRDAVVAQQ